MHPDLDDFIELLRQTYIPPMAKERNMREFHELSESGKTLLEYVIQFCYLERYCPHLFNSDGERVGKFI